MGEVVNADPKLVQLVHLLKDSKAQVLFAFLFAGRALSTRDIQSWTGLKRETVYKVVDSLESMGLLAHQVAAHGRKIFLPAGDVLPIFQMSTLWTPEISTTTTDSLPLLENENQVVVVEEPSQMSTKRTSGNHRRQMVEPDFTEYEDLTYETYSASFETNWKMCKHKGIGEPARTKLALLEHVSPELIKAHVESLVHGEGIGLAIRRIEGNELPRSWEESAQKIAEELRRKTLDADDVEIIEEDETL